MASQELKVASDDKLRDVPEHADPMVVRTLSPQATSDGAVENMQVGRVPGLFMDAP